MGSMVHRLRCLRRPRPNHDPSLSFEVSRSVTGEDWSETFAVQN